MKRYDPEPDHYGGCDMCSAKMIECVDGDYVLFDEAKMSAMCEANSNAVLAEVRAIEKALEIMDELIRYHAHYCDTEMYEEKTIREKAVKAIQKISEHFS